jgi:hypothetical protein
MWHMGTRMTILFFSQALETSKSHVNVHDFDFIRVIGRGSYAKVIYVSNILTLIYLYLKCGL